MTGREKEIVRHLSEDDLDRLLTQTDSEKVSKRLTFVRRLDKGATLEDAADDVGMSQSTGSRWATLWNNGGLGLLTPSFGGGRPRSLMRSNESGSLICLQKASPGRNRKLSTSSIKSSTPSSIRIICHGFSMISASRTRFRVQRGQTDQRTLTKFSTNALPTRSPRMMETSHTTNSLKTTVTTNGRSTMIFERTVVRPSVSSMFRIHNRGTIPSGSTR